MLERDNGVSAEKVKNVFLGIDAGHQNLLELFDRHNEERKLSVGKSISEATCNKYRVTRNHLSDFIRLNSLDTKLPYAIPMPQNETRMESSKERSTVRLFFYSQERS
jgi:hypothetical protein